MSAAERRLLARETAISFALATSLAAVLLWATPPGIDWAAHAYQRTFLIEHGFTIWNNFWYAGRYSFVTYSLIYYPLAALFGIRVLALASIATAAAAFTLVVVRQWGPRARLSSRTFAVLWVGIVGSAAFPFALAVSFALLSLWALQEGRRGRFAVGAVLTLAASPLAFILLAIAGAGALLSRRSLRNVGTPVAAVVLAAAGELLLIRLFGGVGRFPFHLQQLLPALIFVGLGLAVTWGVTAARPLRGFFAIYLVVVVAAYVIPSGVGSNIDRVRYVALPLALICCTLRQWRPLWLVVPTLALAGVWNATPIADTLMKSTTDPEIAHAYWAPAIQYLHRNLSPSYRVEAVDTEEHWPALYLPEAGIPIVRGWYRQSDFPQNELLYDHLTARSYLTWLRRLSVRYVVLTDAAPDYSARNEVALLRSGGAELPLVAVLPHALVYEVPSPTPLVTGPGHPHVESLSESAITVRLSQPGRYKVGIRYTPYLRSPRSCVSEAKDGMTVLTAPRAGTIELRFAVTTKGALAALTGSRTTCQSPG